MRFVDRVLGCAHKHDSLLFTIGEIGLATAALIFAVKNTNEYIMDREEEINQAPKEPAEKCKDILQHYWPTMALYGGYVTLSVLDCKYTQNVKQEYAKAIIAAQSALLARSRADKSKQEHKDGDDKNLPSVVDEGSDDDRVTNLTELRDIHTYEQYYYQFWFDADDMPEPEESTFNSPNCTGTRQLFYIPVADRLFVSTYDDVIQAETYVRAQIESGNSMMLNELYKYLGIGSDNLGAELYIEGDPKDVDDDMFVFDLAPACMDYNDGFDSKELMWTINPNRVFKNVNVRE